MSLPLSRLSPVCVYCGSARGRDPAYVAGAGELGAALGRHALGMVYGGGRRGLMGDVADAALAAGSRVTGIITRQLVDMETAHDGLPDLRIVATMHERKMLMATLASSFVALPGGVGTLDELFEILAWSQLGLHAKPVGILNTAGYYDRLLEFIAHMDSVGFLRIDPRRDIVADTDPDRLLQRMAGHTL
ncbi:MAG: TIGR00730 family Rossman fold protein [Phycisphaerales bacterium]